MSDAPVRKTETKNALTLAQFPDTASLSKAAEKVRDAGYTKWDCHSPFPVHGLDRAMGEGQSPLGWIVGFCALLGAGGAMFMQWWMNAFDYPLVISGKAFFSFQAFVPVTFELSILLSCFGAVFGMFALNGLPLLHHPIFNSERFQQATDDGFFISIEARDPKYTAEETKRFLESVGGENVEVITEEEG